MNKIFGVLLLAYLPVACSVQRMLQESFPIHIGDTFLERDGKTYWIFSYDTDKDGECDLRVWFYVDHVRLREDGNLGVFRMNNPIKVQLFHLGLLIEEREDTDMDGKMDKHGGLVDGYWVED